MKLKQAILKDLDRDCLKEMIETLEIEEVDRRSVEAMRAKLSRSRRATPELLLTHLDEKQVKTVCELMKIDSTGRRGALVQKLLEQFEHALPKKGKKVVVRTTPNKRTSQKESTFMSKKHSDQVDDEQNQPPVRLPDPPAGMMRVIRTELVWPGKYNEDGMLKEVPRVNLPFQVIETVNESRATREAKKGGMQRGLFDVWEGKEGGQL